MACITTRWRTITGGGILTDRATIAGYALVGNAEFAQMALLVTRRGKDVVEGVAGASEEARAQAEAPAQRRAIRRPGR